MVKIAKAGVIFTGCMAWGELVLVPFFVGFDLTKRYHRTNNCCNMKIQTWTSLQISHLCWIFLISWWMYFSKNSKDDIADSAFIQIENYQGFFPSCKIEIIEKDAINCIEGAYVLSAICLASAILYSAWLFIPGSWSTLVTAYLAIEIRREAPESKNFEVLRENQYSRHMIEVFICSLIYNYVHHGNNLDIICSFNDGTPETPHEPEIDLTGCEKYSKKVTEDIINTIKNWDNIHTVPAMTGDCLPLRFNLHTMSELKYHAFKRFVGYVSENASNFFITNEKDIEIMQEFALHNLPTNLELIELNASAENALMKEKLRHAWICKTNLEGKKYWFNSISKKYVLEEPKELENEE